MRILLASIVSLAPAFVAAEMHEGLGTGLLVNDPRYCEEMLDVDPELHVWNVIGAGGEVLSSTGLSLDEVDCAFKDEIVFSWQGLPTQLTLAACYAGDMIQPTIFAIDIYPEVPGEVTLWMQDGDMPTQFYTCDYPG